MRQILIVAVFLLLLGGVRAEVRKVPVVALPRETFENMIWYNDRAKMGDEYVQGSVQGLGGASDAMILYKLGGDYQFFEARVGYVQGTPGNHSAVFEVWADGVLLYNTPSVKVGDPPLLIRVPVAKREMMQLRIRPDQYEGTHGAAFGEPLLYNGVGPDFMNTLTINNNGRITRQSTPARVQDVDVTVPLMPGKHEYTITVDYDEKAGQVDIVTTRAGGEPMPPTTPR